MTRATAVLAAVLLAAACDAPAPDVPPPATAPAAPAAPEDTTPPFPEFRDVSASAGLTGAVLHAGMPTRKNWVLETIGGGAAALDFDDDGDQDLLVVCGADMDEQGEVVVPAGCRTRLFENLGGLHFRDVTDAAGIDVTGYTLGCSAADYDGDGHVDAIVVGYDLIHLLRNRGDGTFEDVTTRLGIAIDRWSCASSASWGDLDGDGRLDLVVCRYVDQREMIERIRRSGRRPRQCMWRGMTTYCGPAGLVMQSNLLFLQRGDGTFERQDDWCDAAPGPSLQALLVDVDADGDLDVYVANDGRYNELLVNDGHARFTNLATMAGCAASDDGLQQASMGLDSVDLDGDGRPEIAVTNFSDEYNALYRNRSTAPDRPLFEERAIAAHFGVPRQERVCWTIALFDFDCDTYTDAFVTAGHVYPGERAGDGPVLVGEHRVSLQRGHGGLRNAFEDVSRIAGAPFDDARQWRGACVGDFDDDGDPDIVALAQQRAPAVLENVGGARRGWISFDLHGRAPLTSPAGVVVAVTLPGGRVLRRALLLGSGYAGSHDPRLHFGVDGALRVRVQVTWPGGEVVDLGELATGRLHRVDR